MQAKQHLERRATWNVNSTDTPVTRLRQLLAAALQRTGGVPGLRQCASNAGQFFTRPTPGQRGLSVFTGSNLKRGTGSLMSHGDYFIPSSSKYSLFERYATFNTGRASANSGCDPAERVHEKRWLSARLGPMRLAISGDNPTVSMICPIALLRVMVFLR